MYTPLFDKHLGYSVSNSHPWWKRIWKNRSEVIYASDYCFFLTRMLRTIVHDSMCVYCYYYIHRNLNQNGSPLSQRDTGEQSIQFYSYLHHCKPMRNKKKIIHSDQFHNYLFFSSFILSWLSC